MKDHIENDTIDEPNSRAIAPLLARHRKGAVP